MGQEINSAPLRIERFLGLNLIKSDTAIDFMEASALQNVDITIEALEGRGGSTWLSSNLFKDKTDTDAKVITGLYSGIIGGTRYQVGTGGDAFKQLTGGAWVDRTGAITITDSADNLVSFATFWDNGGNEVIIGAPEQAGDTRFKWAGGVANAAALAATPGNFKFPIVRANKLWVAVDDYLYLSALNNCETWDTVYDVVRFRGQGEDISGLIKYADRTLVAKPTSIILISGTSYDTGYEAEEIVTNDGFVSGYSLQVVESRRYGTIVIGLSKEGIIKGFNGSKNLIPLGDPVKPLFDKMNRTRDAKCGSAVFKAKKQYWLGMSYGTDATHSQIMVYDYYNDVYSDKDGMPLSSNLYHVGINANCMAIFETATAQEMLVTADYAGKIFRQDNGLMDEGSIAVESKWTSGKIDFGSPKRVKLIADLVAVTTQSSETHLGVSITSDQLSGSGTAVIPTGGSLWGTMIWGTSLWSAPDTKYTRIELTPSDAESAVAGRYFLLGLTHTAASEAMCVEDVIIGISDLGEQPQYVEA